MGKIRNWATALILSGLAVAAALLGQYAPPSAGQSPGGLASGVLAGNFPSPTFALSAITPNGPNLQYEYEVAGVSLLGTGATTVFTTASGLGRFHGTNASIEVTSATGSAATGTLAGKFGTAGADSFTALGAGFSMAVANSCFATGVAATCYITVPVGLNNGTYDGGASIAPSTAVGLNITSAYATATTVVATVRIWGFYE